MKQKYIIITNFHKYQHYSDRGIKWVKLYVSMLTDYKLRSLNWSSRYLFFALLCMSSTNLGHIEYDLSYIKEVIGGQGIRNDRLKQAISDLESLALITISASLDKIRVDKIRIDKSNTFKKTVDNFKNEFIRRKRI